MKIIFINRFFYPDQSATSVLLTDLARYLASRGREVVVLTGRQRYDDPLARLDPEETADGVRIIRVWTTRFGRYKLAGRFMDYFSFYISSAFRLIGLVAKKDVVVAETDPPLISTVAALAARLRGGTLVTWNQDIFPEIARALRIRGFDGPVFAVLRSLRNSSLKAAKANVTIDRGMSECLAEQGASPRSLVVIPNWADGGIIAPLAPENNPLRKEWGLTDKFVVGYTGNFGRIYDFSEMINAARLMRNQKGIIFLFVGAGPQLAAVKKECEVLGLDNARFAPYQPPDLVTAVLGAPDVHVICQRPEVTRFGLPSKFYGILAAGRPLIYVGRREDSIAETVLREKCGFFVPHGDADEFVRVAGDLARRPELVREAGKNARSVFEKNYDKRIALKKWEDLLSNLNGAAHD